MSASVHAPTWPQLPPLGRLAACCLIVLAATTALFFSLHYIGNHAIPLELAKQRFKAEVAAEATDPGYAKQYKIQFEYCELSAAVLVGARAANHRGLGDAVRNAIIPGTIPDDYGCRRRCYQFEAAAHGVPFAEQELSARHWWGNKAIYAIALRYLSVAQIREATLGATRVAHLLLLACLLALGTRALLAGAPLVLLDAISGIEYWADIANGLPYLWTVIAVAVLALVLRRPLSSKVAPVYCVVFGTVSSFLWLGDGHGLLAATWIGLLGWIRADALGAAGRAGVALCGMALYAAGFVASFGLCLLVKSAFSDGVWPNLWEGVSVVFDETVAGYHTGIVAQLGEYLRAFYIQAWLGGPPAGALLSTMAVASLAVAGAVAAWQARRRQFGPLLAVLWIVVLLLVSAPQFLITEHMAYRTARFAFVPHALCFSCVVLVALQLDLRHAAVMLGLWVAVFASSLMYFSDSRAIGRLVREHSLLVSSVFDVYHDEDALVFFRNECGDADVASAFFLHVHPVDDADLPPHRMASGFDNLDFHFDRYDERGYSLQGGGRCAAVAFLPEYAIGKLVVGQVVPAADGHSTIWREEVELRKRSP